MVGIYKITNPKGKIYIGQTVDLERRRNQYSLLNCKDQPALYNSFLKHGFENHSFDVLEECEVIFLNEKERFWQEKYDSVKTGLNCKYVSTNEKTGYYSEETKAKISKASLGNKRWLGRKHKEESKLKISISNKGKRKGCVISEKQRKEHSLAMKGINNPNAKIVLNIENGIFYYTIKEASQAYNININTLQNKLSGYKRNNTSLVKV